ncbi:hypothetical protein [Rhizobium sp. R693]|uniref:type IV toxin-antitoxin system AbiEi family antitoxin domain-containing protein n=1 Tax=Rhizobium sp. R693 TaxID=1764276 RepID=UPI000B52F0DE|nr:hypothetical protein [Rhizobium sp. R693]OWV85450.1 hypothetical protein ATY79_29685 [Rhizobium sp. R693]
MVTAGLIERPTVGFYALPGRIERQDIDWVAFSLRCPRGVIGLQSAALYHNMTDQRPGKLQAFIPRSRGLVVFRLDSVSQTTLDPIVSRNPFHLTLGVALVKRSGIAIRVTSKEKTLVDLFLFSEFKTITASDRRVRVPEETVLEAMARCTRDSSFSFDTFHEIADAFGCAQKVLPFSKASQYIVGAPRGFAAKWPMQ